MTATKDTNPKDAIAGTKLPLDLVPSVIEIFAALGFLEGAVKYGKFNWRMKGVKASVYIAALKRHLKKYENGEWADKKTKVPHLGSMIACIGILLDAWVCGKLTDDRAPRAPISDLIDGMDPLVIHIKELFKEHSPHQYTIQDSPDDDAGIEGQGAREAGAQANVSVLAHARAKRDGKAGARLPRVRAGADHRGHGRSDDRRVRRGRNKKAGR